MFQAKATGEINTFFGKFHEAGSFSLSVLVVSASTAPSFVPQSVPPTTDSSSSQPPGSASQSSPFFSAPFTPIDSSTYNSPQTQGVSMPTRFDQPSFGEQPSFCLPQTSPFLVHPAYVRIEFSQVHQSLNQLHMNSALNTNLPNL